MECTIDLLILGNHQLYDEPESIERVGNNACEGYTVRTVAFTKASHIIERKPFGYGY